MPRQESTILIVDDEEDQIYILSELFADEVPDVKIVSARNFTEGQKVVLCESPQIVIVDYLVTGRGEDTLKFLEFLQVSKITKVILTTGYSKRFIDGIDFTWVEFLMKPYELDELLNMVMRLL